MSSILNDCIYRAWFPGDCDTTLENLQNDLDEGTLREKINVALFHVADEGRKAGGATPRENFQVYVTSYMTFFNQDNPQCNDISWSYWHWSTPKLTTDLRKKLNDLTTQVNKAVKSAAEDLKSMGIIFVDGLEDVYKGHRFCEPGHTDQQMIDYDTWFWSLQSHQNTLSEGPGDPKNPYSTTEPDPRQALLDFLFPNGDVKASAFSESSPPWDQPGLREKYPDYDSLIKATLDDGNATTYAIPFNLLRSFHPKGTAHGHHKDLFMGAIADNRDHVDAAAAAPPPSPPSPPPPEATNSCDVSYQFWYDEFEVRGKDFDPAKFGQDGSGLHDQIKGCGKITKWHFEQTPDDPRFAWFASGNLPIGVKACVGRAVKSAGGTSAGNCHGAG